MPTITSTVEQPLATLATHQEMDEFSKRHGLPLVPLDFAEFEVQAIAIHFLSLAFANG